MGDDVLVAAKRANRFPPEGPKSWITGSFSSSLSEKSSVSDTGGVF